jgi:nicotinamide mononucleotide transporter
LSVLELFAALTGLLYLGLITIKQRPGWIFGCISSLIYMILCFQQNLFLQSGLQVIYLFLGVYGYFSWNKVASSVILGLSSKQHVIILTAGCLISLITGTMMSKTNQQLPYLDALITIFSIIATFLTTKSILENWIYWIVINILAIYLFVTQEMHLTALLFLINTIGSVYGYLNWRKIMSQKNDKLTVFD